MGEIKNEIEINGTDIVEIYANQPHYLGTQRRKMGTIKYHKGKILISIDDEGLSKKEARAVAKAIGALIEDAGHDPQAQSEV